MERIGRRIKARYNELKEENLRKKERILDLHGELTRLKQKATKCNDFYLQLKANYMEQLKKKKK